MISRLAGISVGWLGISMVADGLPALVLPYRAAVDGLDATALGLVTLVAIAAGALVQPLAGSWSDRLGRGPVVAAGAALAAVGLMIVLRPGGLWAGALLSLVGVGVAQAGYQALLPDRVATARRGLASGAKGLFDVGGAFLAFLILGWLLASGHTGLAGPILAAGVAVSLGIGLALLGRDRSPREREPVGDVDRRLPPGFVAAVAARFLFLLAVFGVGRFLFLFLAERGGGGPAEVAAETGGILALLTLITVAAALPAGWLADRVGRSPLMAGGGLAGGAGMLALAGADGSAAVLAAGGLMAIGSAAFGAGNWATLADASAGPRSGRLLGIANFGTAGAAAAAGLFGPVVDNAGFGVAFGVAAGLAVIGGVIGWRTTPGSEPVPEPVMQGADG